MPAFQLLTALSSPFVISFINATTNSGSNLTHVTDERCSPYELRVTAVKMAYERATSAGFRSARTPGTNLSEKIWWHWISTTFQM